MIVAYLLFTFAGIVLVGLAALLWQLWKSYARITPEEEGYERSVASLSDSQAHQMSDEQLSRPIDPQAGWEIMVRRGQGKRQKVKGKR
jgi:hypothetical protein